jgi:hypothetical protein
VIGTVVGMVTSPVIWTFFPRKEASRTSSWGFAMTRATRAVRMSRTSSAVFPAT